MRSKSQQSSKRSTNKEKATTQNQIDPDMFRNTFNSILQPKRISYDFRLYMQMHRKISRTNFIEKMFQSNNSKLKITAQNPHQGFKGRKLPSSNARRNKFISEKKEEEGGFQPAQIKENGTKNPLVRTIQIKKVNLMSNLDLCRRNYRKRLTSTAEEGENKRKNQKQILVNYRFYRNKRQRSKQNLSSLSLRN